VLVCLLATTTSRTDARLRRCLRGCAGGRRSGAEGVLTAGPRSPSERGGEKEPVGIGAEGLAGAVLSGGRCQSSAREQPLLSCAREEGPSPFVSTVFGRWMQMEGGS
jgi:hypothetical protein